jgi:hypothetical protein
VRKPHYGEKGFVITVGSARTRQPNSARTRQPNIAARHERTRYAFTARSGLAEGGYRALSEAHSDLEVVCKALRDMSVAPAATVDPAAYVQTTVVSLMWAYHSSTKGCAPTAP